MCTIIASRSCLRAIHPFQYPVHRYRNFGRTLSTIRFMSLKAAIDTVKSPVKELLLSATQDGSELAGSSEKDQIEVVGWVEKVGREELAADASLPVSPMFLTRSGLPIDGSAGVELAVAAADVRSQQLLDRSGRRALRCIVPQHREYISPMVLWCTVFSFLPT